MVGNPENYLFVGLERAFGESYNAAKEALTQIRNKELLTMARAIVKRAQENSDEITSQYGPYEEGDAVVITAAAFEYGDMIEFGETVVKKFTPWLDYEPYEVAGRQTQLSLRLESVEFVKFKGDNPASRPGPVTLHGKLTDSSGIIADFPLVRLLQKPDGKVVMNYCFSSPIDYDTEDYKKVEAMIEFMDQKVV